MQRPQLSFWQIWNMCVGFFGIQVGFALQSANVSRIFETLGAKVDQVPILWIAAPLTGLLVQPVIGYMSDRTWGRFGRRRPYFFFGALFTTAALIFMPYSPYLWIAAGMLWILDASINITMEPFRAFVGDNLPPKQRTVGFAMQTFFIGSGAVFASALPWMLTNWLGIANEVEGGGVPPNLKLAFAIGAACVLFTVFWTVFFSKEYAPNELAEFEKAEKQIDDASPAKSPGPSTASSSFTKWGLWLTIISGALTALVFLLAGGYLPLGLDGLNINELYFATVSLTVFGVMLLIAGRMKGQGKDENPFLEVMDDIFAMPKTMKQLAIVQFFSWFALFTMWIFTTPAIAAFHYNTEAGTDLYNDAGDWVGILFAVYNGIAALIAVAIPLIAARTSRKLTHSICLAAGGLGLVSIWTISDPSLLWISMIGIGIAWASILSVPYSILTGALPGHKMGVYMGIFNFFIVIPQMLAASVMGLFIRYVAGGEAIYALILGGISMLIAAVAIHFVDDKMEA
ncbi:MAG: MFS transporter [Pseudomonadota bacterium]